MLKFLDCAVLHVDLFAFTGLMSKVCFSWISLSLGVNVSNEWPFKQIMNHVWPVIKLFFLVFVISRIYFCHMVCKHPVLHPMLRFLSKPVLLYPFTLKQQVLLLSIKKCKFVSNVCIFHFDILLDRDNHIFMETLGVIVIGVFQLF